MNYSLTTVFEFLNALNKNNNRPWFQANKTQYDIAHQHIIAFAEALLSELRKYDDIETISGKKSLFRIYRDVRFSKEKAPYKVSWSGSFRRASKSRRGGYYFHIEPGNTFIAGGFFGPNPEDLKQIRKHIDQDDAPLRKVLEDHEKKAFFGSLEGEQVKTAPKGFPIDHHAIDLLRYKQFIMKHQFSDKDVLHGDFHKNMAFGFSGLLPFFDVMSEYLITDLNGISLL